MLKVFELDPWLLQKKEEIIHRKQQFEEKCKEIEALYGSLQAFASQHTYLGIHFKEDENCWIYREWAPEAEALYLTGDFNKWNKHSHPLRKTENGIWEIKLNADFYKDKFFHTSKVKVFVKTKKGKHFRIPAYINRVIQDEDSKNFSGQVWNPSPFEWGNDTFLKPSNLFIYEAHVGMAQEKEGIGTYKEFTDYVLPRIKKSGYTAIQLMAIQEHPYYGSFGYHVSNFFAPSSRFGTPEDLKLLIKTAHEMGIAVIMDIVHSHSVKNINEGINCFDGTETQYFYPGIKGEHPLWDSKLFNYGKDEVLRFLLSNIHYWISEFHFDGFRFDGVGSMLYFHHGLEKSFSRIDDYFTDVDNNAILYLQLANKLIHQLNKNAITIAEDVTGMPALTVTCDEGGIGFDYRLAMGIPDFWINYLSNYTDDKWSMQEIWNTLTNRLSYVNTVAYCESHDQALVGDKTIAFRLMDKEMYHHMNSSDDNIIVERGIALHKMIRLITIALGGQAYLNFMGNEFGHPEWIDFPRAGNNWSYKYAQRKWSLADNPLLQYHYLLDFDKNMIKIVQENHILTSDFPQLLSCDETNKCLIFRRNKLLFIFNFNSSLSIPGYKIAVEEANKYKIILCTDSVALGGRGRVDENMIYSSQPTPKGNILQVYLPTRTAIVMKATIS